MIMMDSMLFMRGSSSRSISASAQERTLLLGALATHMGVLDTRENDAQTVLRKSELWDDITRHFNSNTSTPRSRQQIQTLYKNMKAKARRYEARLAEVATGIPPPDPDPISEMLLGLLQQQLRHQQRHLRNLVARDTKVFTDDMTQSSELQQLYSPFINPEQMMQVSLNEEASEDMKSEGITDDGDFKSEKDENDGTESLTNGIHETNQNHTELPAMTEAIDMSSSRNNAEEGSNLQISNSPVNPPNNTNSLGNVDNSDCQLLSPGSPSSDVAVGDIQNQSVFFTPPSQHEGQNITSHYQNGIIDPYLQLANRNNISQPLANSINLFSALKNLGSLNSTRSKNIRQRSMSPTRKRRCTESNYMDESTSGIKTSSCCCPEIHSKILEMAEDEHQLKMSLLIKDQELREREHTARMRILTLEEEEANIRLRKLQSVPYTSDETEHTGVNNGLGDEQH